MLHIPGGQHYPAVRDERAGAALVKRVTFVGDVRVCSDLNETEQWKSTAHAANEPRTCIVIWPMLKRSVTVISAKSQTFEGI